MNSQVTEVQYITQSIHHRKEEKTRSYDNWDRKLVRVYGPHVWHTLNIYLVTPWVHNLFKLSVYNALKMIIKYQQYALHTYFWDTNMTFNINIDEEMDNLSSCNTIYFFANAGRCAWLVKTSISTHACHSLVNISTAIMGDGCLFMMTPWNGNIFRVTGHLSGEVTGPRWIPHKGQWRGALMFSLICVWINGWVKNREGGDLRRHRAHYDVIVMLEGHCGCHGDVTLAFLYATSLTITLNPVFK